MTRDEILRMKPGRELDILIAEKVFGWKRIEGPHYDYNGPCEYGDVLIPPEMSEDEAFAMMPPKGKVPLGYFVTQKYSTDISAAWEIIEKFPIFEIEKHSIFSSTYFLPPTWPKDGIWCVLMDEKWNRFVGYGETAPEAICKAALLAKNVV
jgi:hypothetical protein